MWPRDTGRHGLPFSSSSTTRRAAVVAFEPASTEGFYIDRKYNYNHFSADALYRTSLQRLIRTGLSADMGHGESFQHLLGGGGVVIGFSIYVRLAVRQNLPAICTRAEHISSSNHGHHQATAHLAEIFILYFHCVLYFNESFHKLKYACVPFVIYALTDICLRPPLVFMFARAVYLLWRPCFAC
jgi:hypothetical protein